MEKIISLLRCLILMVSCVGYLLWLTRYMRGEFALGFLFSGIGALLFLAGILNCLKEGAITIYLGGLILCVRERHRIGRKTLLTHGTVFFAAAAVFFFFLLKDARFTHYDNFSHWARAVAVLLKRNAFPSFLDEGIRFSAYPTGSASFIYYVVKVLGVRQEWPQMWAQAFLMAGLVAGLFAFGDSRGKRILILGGAIILLAGNTSFCDLLVDTLLPITALSAMAFCVYYREEIREKFLFLLPYLVFLVSIKNRGALFAALILFYVYLLIRPVGRGPVLKHWLLVCLVPLAVLLLWEKHVSQVFPGGEYTKHAMTLSYYKSVLFSKSWQTSIITLTAYTKKFFLGGRENWLFFLAAVPMYIVSARQKRETRRILSVAMIGYCVYMLAMLGMYLFSMPATEALRLAGYERYHRTILVFCWGLVLIAFAHGKWLPDHTVKPTLLKTACGILTLLLMMGSVRPNLSYYQRQDLRGTERAKLDGLIETYEIQPEKSYLFLVSDQRNDGGLLYYLTGYLLDSEDFLIRTPTTVEEVTPELFEYVILYEDTPECRAYFRDQLGEATERVIKYEWEDVRKARKQFDCADE